MDDHGSHVAGTIGGVGNNGVGVAGAIGEGHRRGADVRQARFGKEAAFAPGPAEVR